MKKIILVLLIVLPIVTLANTSITTYYFGEEIVKNLEGEKLFSSVRVVKRMENLKQSKITEVFTYAMAGKVKEVIFYMNVEGRKMELTTASGILSGTGVLFGPPKKRNGWRADLKYADGSEIKFLDSVINGDVYSAFNYFDNTGKMYATSNTVYRRIQKESYELMRNQLLK